MKVLILGSKEYPMGTNKGDDPLPSGGIEIYTTELVPRLEREKIKPIVITRKFKAAPSFEKKGDIQIYRVPWIKGFYFRNISFNFAAFLKALSLDFDIILSNGLFANLFGVILGRIRKRPVITVAHGTAFVQPQYKSPLQSIMKKIESKVYFWSDCVVSLANNTKENFMKFFGKLPKCWKVIPLGIEIASYQNANGEKIKKEFGLENSIVITFTGRLLKVKGIEYLIKAAKKLEGDFRILIVGTGNMREELERLSKELGLEDRIIFTGFRKDIPDILAASDIYVLPSLSEGLSISVLEAKARGLACVVTDIGLPVKDGENALVVLPEDADSLSMALQKMIDERELRQKLSENSKKDAKKNFSWEKIVRQYIELFEKYEN